MTVTWSGEIIELRYQSILPAYIIYASDNDREAFLVKTYVGVVSRRSKFLHMRSGSFKNFRKMTKWFRKKIRPMRLRPSPSCDFDPRNSTKYSRGTVLRAQELCACSLTLEVESQVSFKLLTFSVMKD